MWSMDINNRPVTNGMDYIPQIAIGMTFQLHIQYEFQQQVFELIEESLLFKDGVKK